MFKSRWSSISYIILILVLAHDCLNCCTSIILYGGGTYCIVLWIILPWYILQAGFITIHLYFYGYYPLKKPFINSECVSIIHYVHPSVGTQVRRQRLGKPQFFFSCPATKASPFPSSLVATFFSDFFSSFKKSYFSQWPPLSGRATKKNTFFVASFTRPHKAFKSRIKKVKVNKNMRKNVKNTV